MGQCCCSLCKRFLPSSVIELSGSAAEETTDESLLENSIPQVHSINPEMSAPSIEVANDLGNEVKGYGLALTDVSVEQESCYWEWRVRTGDDNRFPLG